jgi:starch-binding outer membrane protein, SusD/RagB family
MKLYIKNAGLIIPLLIALSITSCKKYLELKPDSKLAVPTSINDLQAILDYTNDMNLQTTPGFGSSSTVDYFLLEADYNMYPLATQKVYYWQRGEYNFINDWSKGYHAIFNANYCLEQIDKIKVSGGTKPVWDNVKGSALFCRSFYFLHLLWDYAKAFDSSSYNQDLGIVLRLGSDFNVPSVRASVKECYDRVIQDAKSSLEYLPDYPLVVLRPSKGAAYGLLANAYLSMRIYDSAFKYSALYLQLNNKLIDYNGDPDINGDISNDAPFKKFNKETAFYTTMNSDLLNNSFIAKIDTVLYAMYDSNDLRKTAFFEPVDSYFKFKCIYTGDIYYYFTGIATDEMYLVKAECEARKGNVANAMNDLNTLLVKRWKAGTFVPLTASNADDALHIILAERRKELVDRGRRWMDIKRLNKENANIVLVRKIEGQTYMLQPNANYYALPLPADIIKASGIPQNEP